MLKIPNAKNLANRKLTTSSVCKLHRFIAAGDFYAICQMPVFTKGKLFRHVAGKMFSFQIDENISWIFWSLMTTRRFGMRPAFSSKRRSLATKKT
jgi:hypothetical protein